jgi:hypothetical protein
MSATLYFTNSENQTVRPWACQCVRRLSSDEFERSYGMLEDCGCEDRDCNMSNRNTRTVLAALGLSTDFENDAPMLPQELWAACNRFLSSDIAGVVDCGRDAKVSGNMVECGLPEGYIAGRVQQIVNLCAEAMLDGATRCYFC